jgi:arylamine N-acetyltransferase
MPTLSDHGNFDRYLNLLGVPRRLPTMAALFELVKAHALRIPFENISKLHYLRRQDLRHIPDVEQYLDGIAQHNLGGTCYSNSYYLHRLLAHLGYDPMLCGADMVTPDGHMVNMVAVEGREFLIDVGYAAPFLEPLPRDLDVDVEIVLGRDRYVLRPKDTSGCTRMDLYRDGELIHGYTAKPIARDITFFTDIIRRSFLPCATFMNSLLAVRLIDNSSIAIYNLSVIESAGASYRIRELADRSELSAEVERQFGIPHDIVVDAVSMIGEFGNAWT